MKIICLEGCHGVGKTEIISRLAAKGYSTIGEGFLDMSPSTVLQPQGYLVELLWVAKWIETVIALTKSSRDEVIFADRSPYSAAVYAREGFAELKSAIDLALLRLEAEVGIKVQIIRVDVEPKCLWQRISRRLEREPARRAYREDDKVWMDKVVGIYRNLIRSDFVISNDGNGSVVKTAEDISRLVFQ